MGGSTLINSAICFRTPEPVLAQWRDQFGCRNLTKEWMDGCFERIWKTTRISKIPNARFFIRSGYWIKAC